MDSIAATLRELAGTITERVTATTGTQLVFGPTERHGEQTVIPVAEVRYAFGLGAGGGSGSNAEGQSQGSGSGGGGGGGVRARPVGFIRLEGDEADFIPIIDYTRIIIVWLVCATFMGVTFARTMRRRRERWYRARARARAREHVFAGPAGRGRHRTAGPRS